MKPIRGRYLRDKRPLLLVVGIRPGKQEVSAKSVFVGPSGKLLVKVLNEEWPHGVYLMNAIPVIQGSLDDWFQFTFEEASSVDPDYILALGAEARLWAIRAAKDLPNVKRVRYHQNPAAALEGHIPVQRWVEITRSILRTLTSKDVGIVVRSPSDVVAIDTECKGHPCDGFHIVAATDGERELVTDDPDEVQRFIKGRHIVAHNAVYDLIALESRGVKVDGPVDCTMTMKGILDPEGSRDLDILAAYELRVDLGSPPYTEWKKGKVPDQIMGQFALYHARATLELYRRFSAPARAYPVYTQLYQPLLKVLSSMSRLRVDLEGLERKKEELLRESQQISEKLREFSGINWNSCAQVAEYFMKTGSEIPLTEKGHPSVSEEVLKSLDREEARLLLRKREIEKLLNTYVDPILKTGELRTVYDPVGARTGRMSSKNMNAQNIPNEIRRYVLPPEGHYWMEADYKSAEYAVAAYWSQDPFMLQALKSGDIHTYTARLLIGREPTPEERRDVKAITFGLLYLASPKTVSEYTERLGGSGERAYEMYNRWWDLHRGYLEKIKWLWGELNTHGIYAGLMRRYRCPNGKVTLHDLRLAVNQIIQGGASDVTAQALLKVSSVFKPLTVVHDSLSIAVPEDRNLGEVASWLTETMRSCLYGYIDVEVKFGRSWYDPEFASVVRELEEVAR
jgi:DNA polymerase I-like protein with 3'-5' exonuclease and polymerase domains